MSEAHRIPIATADAPNSDAHSAEAATRMTSTAWTGWATFAGVMLLLIGCFHAIAGFVALFRQSYYVIPDSNLVVTVSYTGWGWVHIIGGIAVFAVGLGLLAGQTWARIVAVGLAGLSALLNIAFLPAWPIWSAIVITLDVIVIYALTVHGKEAQAGSR